MTKRGSRSRWGAESGGSTTLRTKIPLRLILGADAERSSVTQSPLPKMLTRTEFIQALRAVSHSRVLFEQITLLLVDINHFEWINSAYGVEVGDSVLHAVSGAIVEAAGCGQVVGRLDGDRFGVIAFATSTNAVDLARAILAKMREPINVAGHTLHITGRVGIGPGRSDDDEPVTAILRDATSALAGAKSGCVHEAIVHADQTSAHIHRLAGICRDLYHGLANRKLRVAYQPIVGLEQCSVVGYESLARLRSRAGDEIPPSLFIPLAEGLGLVEEVEELVLDEASRICSLIASRSPSPVTMAVNVSPRQFTDPELIPLVDKMLRRYSLEPRSLALEVTESVAVDGRASGTIERLQAMGCKVGLDDFGTGQSCLSYLRSLPVDFIKIDRSFVAALETDPKAVKVVATITAMASDLGLVTVAEGIETAGQYDEVRRAGCLLGQGNLFGKPTSIPAPLEN
jgi:diguanylate cyclase